jgi:hypothetical protein
MDITGEWDILLQNIFIHTDNELSPFKVILNCSDIVSLQFNRYMGLMTAKNIYLPNAIPKDFAPSCNLQFPIFVSSDKEKKIGLLYINNDGDVNIYPGLSIEDDAWGPDTICVLYGTSVSWQKS